MLRTPIALVAVVAAALALAGSALAGYSPAHPPPTTPLLAPVADTIFAPLPNWHVGLSWSASTFDPSIAFGHRRYTLIVDATPHAPSAPWSETHVFYGPTSWSEPVQIGVHYEIRVRASQCFFEFGLCAWTQSPWSSGHFDVAPAQINPPPKG